MKLAMTTPRSNAQRGSALVWILITLIVAGGAFAVYWFVIRGGGGGGAASALVARAIPAEAKIVVGFDPQAVLKSEAFKGAAASQGISLDDINAQLAKANIKPEALKAVVLGINADMNDGVAIFQGDLDPTALKAAIGALMVMSPEAGEVAGALQFESVEGGLVIAGTGDLYTKSLAAVNGKGAAGLDENLAKVLAGIDRGAPVWGAGAIPEDATRSMGPLKSMIGGKAPGYAAMSLDLGDPIKVKIAVLFPGGDASKIADTINTMMSLAPMGKLPNGVGDVLKSLSLSGSGELLSASISISAELLAKMSKDAN